MDASSQSWAILSGSVHFFTGEPGTQSDDRFIPFPSFVETGSLAAGFCCVEQTAVDSTEMGKRKLARGKADPLVSVILPFRNSCRCGTSWTISTLTVSTFSVAVTFGTRAHLSSGELWRGCQIGIRVLVVLTRIVKQQNVPSGVPDKQTTS